MRGKSATQPLFTRYIGIDYSGAETPTSSLKGLGVYLAGRKTLPTEKSPRRPAPSRLLGSDQGNCLKCR